MMNIRKIAAYNTENISLDKLPLEDMINLTIIALYEFKNVFTLTRDNNAFYSPEAGRTIKRCARLLRKVTPNDKNAANEFAYILIGGVMLAKKYQYEWLQNRLKTKEYNILFVEQLLSPQTVDDLQSICSRLFPHKTLQSCQNDNPDTLNDDDFAKSILKIGRTILHKKRVYIDESAYLTGDMLHARDKYKNISALALIIRHLLLSHSVEVKPYPIDKAISARLDDLAKSKFLDDSIHKYFSRSLCKAARDGDVKKMTELLDTFSPLNWENKDKKQTCALSEAAKSGHAKAFELLITHPNSIYTSGEVVEAIKIAMLKEHKTVTDYFLTTYLINEQNGGGNTLLHYATSWGFHQFAVDLLKTGANPNIRNNDGETPLLVAAEMLNNQATPFHYGKVDKLKGIKENVFGISYIFLHKPVKVDGVANVNAQHGVKMMELLLRHKANPDICNNKYNTALDIAVEKKHVGAVSMLLPIVSRNDRWNEPWFVTPLFYNLTRFFSLPILDLFVQHGAYLSYIQTEFGEEHEETFIEHVTLAYKRKLEEKAGNPQDNFNELLDLYEYFMDHNIIPQNTGDCRPLDLLEQYHTEIAAKQEIPLHVLNKYIRVQEQIRGTENRPKP